MLVQMLSPNLGIPKYSDSNYNEIREEYLERYIRNKQTGEPLHGEIHMFKRICEDCHSNSLPWLCFHGLSYDSVQESKIRKMVEIDFLLLCPKGAVVVEVKGGNVNIRDGQYVLSRGKEQRILDESPFDQANNAQFFLLYSSQLLNSLQNQPIFITSCCAFPHANIDRTSDDPDTNLSWKLWSKPREDRRENFADFCLEVIEKSKLIQHKTYNELSLNQLQYIANRIAPTISFVETTDDEIRWQDVIEWLKLNNEDTLRSLRKNERIIVEGGPGTGKTTIAKEFIFLNKEKKGLYLCWNKLLKSSIEHKLLCKGLKNCSVEQYFAFLKKLDPDGELISFEGFGRQSYTDLCFNIACLIDEKKSKLNSVLYDYIIIDEAQDILDRGAKELIIDLTSPDGKINSSKFLIFYDCDQEYNAENRNPEQYIREMSWCSAQFILTENRRVSSTKQIVAFANAIRRGADLQIEYMKMTDPEYIHLEKMANHKDIIKRLNSLRRDLSQKSTNDLVVLLDSNCKWTKSGNGEFLYQRIIDLESVVEIDEVTIKKLHEIGNVPICTILQYKGLESKHVILVVGEKEYQNKAYELYVGITRAIIKIDIWLYGDN